MLFVLILSIYIYVQNNVFFADGVVRPIYIPGTRFDIFYRMDRTASPS